MGYCSIANVVSHYPQFRQNQLNSIQDSQIQIWIDNRKARIRSAFLTRGYDPDAPPNAQSPDQAAFLRGLNEDGAAADLGSSLQGTTSLQPGEYSTAQALRKSFEAMLTAINKGEHDVLFDSGPLGQIARHADPTPLFVGVAGAEVDPSITPRSTGANQFFWKNWRP